MEVRESGPVQETETPSGFRHLGNKDHNCTRPREPDLSELIFY